MKKILKRAINSRTMLLMALLTYTMWFVTSLTEVGIAWTNQLPQIARDCVYPCLFASMFACFFGAFIMWIEESLDEKSHKLAI